MMRSRFLCTVAGVLAAFVSPVAAQPGATAGEWRTYAADTYASKYSSLDQITADNFAEWSGE